MKTLFDYRGGFILLITALLYMSIMQGCALLAQPIAEKVASAVEKYCEESYNYRTIYRNTINSQLITSGHIVHVHCEGDPVTTP